MRSTFHQPDAAARRRSAARIAAGLTVAELAQRLGVTPQRVCNLESGQCNATAKMTLRIAEAIGCDPHSLDPMLASTQPSGRRPGG
jgi:transcriptional regulator with XRE-family HTH domain